MNEQSKLMVRVSFGGNGLDAGDPEAAAKELSNQGYKVHRLPKKYRSRLAGQCDDMIEVVINGDNDEKGIRVAIDKLGPTIIRFGGGVNFGIAIDRDYTPFAEFKYLSQ